MTRSLTLSAVLLSLLLFTRIATAQERPDAGFKPLFNGKDLTGWEGAPELWRVVDGAIVGETAEEGEKKITFNTFLIYKGEVPKNFTLKFDYWLSAKGNSGVQYRSWRNEDKAKPFSVFGYQADFDGPATYSGILYGEGFRGILAGRGLKTEIDDDGKPKTLEKFAEDANLKKKITIEGWNSYEVVADGFTFTHKINGETMSVCIDNDTKRRRDEGVLAIQLHVGPAMKVMIKNIVIKEIKEK